MYLSLIRHVKLATGGKFTIEKRDKEYFLIGFDGRLPVWTGQKFGSLAAAYGWAVDYLLEERAAGIRLLPPDVHPSDRARRGRTKPVEREEVNR